DVGREIAREVGDGVERPPAQAVEAAGALPDHALDPRVQVGTGAAAVEEHEVVAARQPELDQMPARERRPTKHEDAHRAKYTQPHGCVSAAGELQPRLPSSAPGAGGGSGSPGPMPPRTLSSAWA